MGAGDYWGVPPVVQTDIDDDDSADDDDEDLTTLRSLSTWSRVPFTVCATSLRRAATGRKDSSGSSSAF